jgi:hypothetical protein
MIEPKLASTDCILSKHIIFANLFYSIVKKCVSVDFIFTTSNLLIFCFPSGITYIYKFWHVLLLLHIIQCIVITIINGNSTEKLSCL